MGEGEVCVAVPHESGMEKESQLRIECGLSFVGEEEGLCMKQETEEAGEAVEKMDSERQEEAGLVLDNMQAGSSANSMHDERQEAGLVPDNMQADNSANSMHDETLNAGLLPVSEDYVDIVGSEDLEPCSENLPMKVPKESIREEMMNDSEHGDEESVLKEVTIYSELKPCEENQKLEVMETCNSELFTCSEEVKQSANGLCLEPYRGNKSKEASNDDVYSEVLNPNLSPKQMASTLTIGNDHGGCGEITSAYSRDSSSGGSLCEEEHQQDHKMEPTTTSVVLEIPKHLSTTGVRKITFKFSKRKEGSSSNQAAPSYIDEDYYDNPVSVSDSYPLTGNGFHNHEGDPYENAEMNSGEGGSDLSRSRNRELKMSKKIVPDDYPTNVKKLLCTKILDGARVKYISVSGENEIPGIINNGGYVCGCHVCNFSKVLSAYEFELHAGAKTRHPNSHIYLENGKPIYSVIAVLKTATMSTVEDVLRGAAGSSVNEENLQVWKANLLYGTGVAYAEDIHHIQNCGLSRPEASYPIQPNEDSLYPASLHYSRFTPFSQQSYIEAPAERKRPTKKPRHHYSSSLWEKKKPGGGGTKKRDNDLHKLLFMPNGLPDGTELAYYAKGKRILGGYKQGNGIVCSCCRTEISPSQFEAHAGWSAKRQPYRHIYTSSGLALHDIAVMLANGQSIISSGHDDMCAVCGDGEELVLCNGCPRAFHAGCLGLQCLPANDWQCPYCIDKFCTGSKAPGESRPIIVRFTRVVKSPEFEPGGCVVCRSQEFSAANFDEKTVIICDQCEKEYHVGCLRESGMCDLKELPDDKWFCCDACTKIYSALQTLASSGPETIPNSVSTLFKKHPAAALSYESNNDTRWCILSGKSRSPEHLFLLSRAAEIFRECFDPIVAASGRDLIPVMVYGRNISGQEFSGMYCVVLTVKNIVVSAALLRIFGRDVAELPLVATSRENQGKGYFRALFSCIEKFLLSMEVKNLVLPAAEEAEPMWTKKLGFRKTSNEQMRKYTRDLQLTVFQGTSLLLKEVQQCAE